jgi:hypothetical protein
VFLTGTQALVRIPLMQTRFCRQYGFNTAGLISDYAPVRKHAAGGLAQKHMLLKTFGTGELTQ